MKEASRLHRKGLSYWASGCLAPFVNPVHEKPVPTNPSSDSLGQRVPSHAPWSHSTLMTDRLPSSAVLKIYGGQNNLGPSSSTKTGADSMEGRRGQGLTWPPSAEAAVLAGAGRRGKQLKARRLSFTWQMHNSQGSPGDQICPTGNSTPLSSREQPGGGQRGRKDKWAEVPRSGLDARGTHSTTR